MQAWFQVQRTRTQTQVAAGLQVACCRLQVSQMKATPGRQAAGSAQRVETRPAQVCYDVVTVHSRPPPCVRRAVPGCSLCVGYCLRGGAARSQFSRSAAARCQLICGCRLGAARSCYRNRPVTFPTGPACTVASAFASFVTISTCGTGRRGFFTFHVFRHIFRWLALSLQSPLPLAPADV